jgi:hypothetical protein
MSCWCGSGQQGARRVMPPPAARRGGSDGNGVGGEGGGRSVPGDSEGAQPALISTSGKAEVLQVLTGDSLGLTSFVIFSHSTHTVEVSLNSSLDQVSFQLSNGNLDARAPEQLFHDEEDGDEEWDGMLNEASTAPLA